jgi:hypothetical protein
MEFFKRIFRRRKQFKAQPKQLRIDGVKTTLTPTPDDAELAAQALLESRIYGDKEQRKATKKAKPQQGTAEYYRELSDRIRATHEQDVHAATRYVAYVEQELARVNGAMERQSDGATESVDSEVRESVNPYTDLEHGLFKHQDTVEREGGELLKRWQKCLAECILRQMTSADDTNKHEDGIKTE